MKGKMYYLRMICSTNIFCPMCKGKKYLKPFPDGVWCCNCGYWVHEETERCATDQED